MPTGGGFAYADDVSDPVRIDKWLWAARFFKTRSLARVAINGGKVRLNGARVKPGRTIMAGDQLVVQRGDEQFELEVVLAETRRGPATAAREMYRESEESAERRAHLKEQRALERAARAERERRPDKRQRRQIVRFRKRDKGAG